MSRYLPQQDHADLGLVDDDDTEVLTKRKAPVAPEALQKFDNPITHLKGQS
jgi:hypothetical protein